VLVPAGWLVCDVAVVHQEVYSTKPKVCALHSTCLYGLGLNVAGPAADLGQLHLLHVLLAFYAMLKLNVSTVHTTRDSLMLHAGCFVCWLQGEA
jgi:hypothetical protein